MRRIGKLIRRSIITKGYTSTLKGWPGIIGETFGLSVDFMEAMHRFGISFAVLRTIPPVLVCAPLIIAYQRLARLSLARHIRFQCRTQDKPAVLAHGFFATLTRATQMTCRLTSPGLS